MNRRNFVWATVLMGAFVGPLAFASERLLFTDESEFATDFDTQMEDAGTEEYFINQPVPATEDPARAASEAARSARAGRPSARSSYARQARAPNMFGDSPGIGGQLTENAVVFFIPVGGNAVVGCPCGTGDVTDLPGLGGGVLKVSENNKPVPMDRAYFVYNGFQNALTVGQPVPRDVNINRYTVGFEKTFDDGLWSLNVGMPFTNSLDLNSDAFTVNSGSVGNLAVFAKRLNYSDDVLSISSGLGISLPTGSDLTVQFHQFNPVQGRTDTESLILNNQSVHLVPYVGFLSMPTDEVFYQGFLSVDVAANGNDVILGTPGTNVGTLTPQNLLQVDFSAGTWLAQSPDAYYLTGIAAIAEVHYTSTIQDSDTILLPTQPDVGPLVNGQLGNVFNRIDIVNLTAGFQFQIGNFSNLRVAAVIPLRDQPNRQFDSEIQVSFNRLF